MTKNSGVILYSDFTITSSWGLPQSFLKNHWPLQQMTFDFFVQGFDLDQFLPTRKSSSTTSTTTRASASTSKAASRSATSATPATIGMTPAWRKFLAPTRSTSEDEAGVASMTIPSTTLTTLTTLAVSSRLLSASKSWNRLKAGIKSPTRSLSSSPTSRSLSTLQPVKTWIS